MPRRYEAMRDDLIRRGKPEKEAKQIAAATYNKTRKPGQRPVTRNKAGHRTKSSARSLADARRPSY